MPGGFASNRALQVTPELAYGITKWWEIGFYQPFAINGDGILSDGAKIRNLFAVLDAAKRSFFYGVNFELGYKRRSSLQRRGPSKSDRSSVCAIRNWNSSSIPSSI